MIPLIFPKVPLAIPIAILRVSQEHALPLNTDTPLSPLRTLQVYKVDPYDCYLDAAQSPPGLLT